MTHYLDYEELTPEQKAKWEEEKKKILLLAEQAKPLLRKVNFFVNIASANKVKSEKKERLLGEVAEVETLSKKLGVVYYEFSPVNLRMRILGAYEYSMRFV